MCCCCVLHRGLFAAAAVFLILLPMPWTTEIKVYVFLGATSIAFFAASFLPHAAGSPDEVVEPSKRTSSAFDYTDWGMW